MTDGVPDGAPTTAASLAARAAAIGAPVLEPQCAAMLAYLDRILEINKELNLTAVREREKAVVFHLLDSLTVCAAWTKLTQRDSPRTFIDIGTGGGFPGAVLAAAWPFARGLLIDQTGKKVRAVADGLAAAGIENAETMQVRCSQLRALRKDTRAAFDLATARAVGATAEILEEAAACVAPGGYVFAMKGPEPPADEIAAAESSARKLGFRSLPAARTEVPSLERRTILVFQRQR